MATNKGPWIRNDDGAIKPLYLQGRVAAGSTSAIKRGEICMLGKATASIFAPAESGDTTLLAICDEEQKADDSARFVKFIVPRPGDVFEFAMTSARQVKLGETFSITSSQVLDYATSNIVARSADDSNYPRPEEKSVTLRSISTCRVYFDEQASYYSELTGNS